MLEAKYSYQVRPRMPIRGVGDKAILKTTNLDLTKEDVINCLRCGPVFRRFSDDDFHRVMRDTIDKFHVSKAEFYKTHKKDNKMFPTMGSIKIPAASIQSTEKTVHQVAKEEVEIKVEDITSEPIVEEVKEEVSESVQEVVSEAVEETQKEVKEEETSKEEVPETPEQEASEEEKSSESNEEEKVENSTESGTYIPKNPRYERFTKKNKKH